MPGGVQGGPQQIVHRPVHQREGMIRPALEVQHPGQENAGGADDGAAGLAEYVDVQVGQRRRHRVDVVVERRGRIVPLGNAEPAADVDVAESDVRRPELPRQVGQRLSGQHQWREIEQLRADVAADAVEGYVLHTGGLEGQRAGPRHGDAELVLVHAGGDVRMGRAVDVRIDPQRHRRDASELTGDPVDGGQLAGGLDVEAAHARQQRLANFLGQLARPREHDAGGLAAGPEHPRELAARDDVEAGSGAGETAQDRQRRVRLDRIADLAAAPAERVG